MRRHDIGPALPEDDLSLRAARALQQASGTPLGADLSVLKAVPWGAGLGGGSSDAATTLLALNRLWGLNWSRERLLQLALPLGADVPFFVGGRSAFVEGIGEQLTPLPAGTLEGQQFVVVKPPQPIATAAIFGSPLLVRNTEPVIVMSFLADAQLAAKLLNGFGRNDLQPPAEASCPEVTQVAAWLAARHGNSRMSGSGSAVFARIGSADQPLASSLAEDLPPQWVGRLCRSLDNHPLVDWAS
ncbi:MAG: 4-(cytidine 5'-diphospho)-2-C-methyl-D-erythritol kinase [Burkholderiales bacterium PBB5]|nr:MAG: 4-(cytidine 5'-diphospho)-2-C-methyl-D-erythritol kinase [Burkholderiales bacterium PBB5]